MVTGENLARNCISHTYSILMMLCAWILPMNVSKSLIPTSLPGQMVRKTQKTFFEFSLITRGLPKWLSGKRICLPMQEMWICSLGRKDILEKKMATHSSILAWKIPWTEEPSGLQPKGSQRVGHNLATKQQQQ